MFDGIFREILPAYDKPLVKCAAPLFEAGRGSRMRSGGGFTEVECDEERDGGIVIHRGYEGYFVSRRSGRGLLIPHDPPFPKSGIDSRFLEFGIALSLKYLFFNTFIFYIYFFISFGV
jgi:hypothetical protein